MFRSPDKNVSSEQEFIERCAIEDLHGFLQPDQQIRRESIVKFSFMIPIEDLRAEYAAVTHNRVVLEETGKIQAEEAMMIFKREHASGVYGFLTTMDLAYVGRPLANPTQFVIDNNDRRIRAKAAILALSDILTGRFGAASSRATPIMKTIELICAISKQPIPNLIHGFYMDYAEESAKILSSSLSTGLIEELRTFVYGEKPERAFKEVEGVPVEVTRSPMDALVKAAGVVEEWLE